MSTGGVSSEDGKTLRAMAVVQALRPAGTDTRADADRVNVVRLVEALGPISPELVLVDPELAPRARALLPELAWNWRPRAREFEEPISLRVAAVPAAVTSGWRLAAVPAAVTRWRLAAVAAAMTSRWRFAAVAAVLTRWRLAAVAAALTSRWRFAAVAAAMTSRWRLAAVSALVAVGAVAFGLGISVATTDREDLPAVQSRPPLVAPARQVKGPSLAPPAAKKAGAPTAPKKAGSQRLVPVPPRFVWPVEARATGYRVALYLGGRQIFEQDVTKTGLQLPQSWTYKGSFYGLTKGTYRWVVWPLVGSGANVRRGPAIVSARYTV
jgi:hypothetical protein